MKTTCPVELKHYLNSSSQKIEETFAQMFSENNKLTLSFKTEDSSYTNGSEIVIDPSTGDLFRDKKALLFAERMLRLPEKLSTNPKLAIRFISHAINIHECLHILYSDFKDRFTNNPLVKDNEYKKSVLHTIWNIIEDGYIENAGISVYDNIELSLKFLNLGLSHQLLTFLKEETLNSLSELLNIMIIQVKCPVKMTYSPSKNVQDYIKKTGKLFIKGSTCSDPEERFRISEEIFTIIEPLLAPEEQSSEPFHFESPLRYDKHDTKNNSPNERNEPEQPEVTRTLSENAANNKEDFEKLKEDFKDLLKELDHEQEKEGKPSRTFIGSAYSKSYLHSNIQVIVDREFDGSEDDSYTEILKENWPVIRKYRQQFDNLLIPNKEVYEKGFIFGSRLSSNNLADPKHRYWQRKAIHEGVPDLGVCILIDCSGSMMFEKAEKARESAIVLHEILKSQRIPHAVIGHYAEGGAPVVHMLKILDYNTGGFKSNFGSFWSYDCNRDGLALLWCQNYILSNSPAEDNLLLVISDGLPNHPYDNYCPPAAVDDCSKIVKQLIQKGIKVVGLALGGDEMEFDIDNLKRIYPALVINKDLDLLTKQLLKTIAKELLK